MVLRSALIYICFTLIACTLFSAKSYALTVQQIRFGEHNDKTRMVIELDEAAAFKAYVLETPYRVVVDLPHFDWAVTNISKPKSGTIQEVRHGVQKTGYSRLVIDISRPIAIRSAFILPKTATAKDRLVIDFEPVNATTFAQRKDRIFGNLKDDEAPIKPDTIANFVKKNNLVARTQTVQTAQYNTNANIDVAIPSRKPDAPKNFESTTQIAPSSAARKSIIVIDPGHGGADPGAIAASKHKEKHVTLATAKELKRQLEATGQYQVHLTRTTDTYIKLHERVNFARKKNADLFISLHADSINKPNVRGASIYTLSNKASDAQTARLAARENQADLIAGVDLSHEDKEVANILLDLSMRDTMNQSKFLANTLVKTMSTGGMNLLTRPHRYAGFAVLKAPDVPSILVEIGFMSNSREASMLASSTYQKKVAASIVDGVNAYFAKIRKNNSN